MTEQEFLEKRIPIWLEGEDLHVSTPSNSMRVTDIRLKAGFLQVSNNNGRSRGPVPPIY